MDSQQTITFNSDCRNSKEDNDFSTLLCVMDAANFKFPACKDSPLPPVSPILDKTPHDKYVLVNADFNLLDPNFFDEGFKKGITQILFSHSKDIPGMLALGTVDAKKIDSFTQCSAEQQDKHTSETATETVLSPFLGYMPEEIEESEFVNTLSEIGEAVLLGYDYVSYALLLTPGGVLAFFGKKLAPVLAERAGAWITAHVLPRTIAYLTTNAIPKVGLYLGSQVAHGIAVGSESFKPDGEIVDDLFGDQRWVASVPLIGVWMGVVKGAMSRWPVVGVAFQGVFSYFIAEDHKERIHVDELAKEDQVRLMQQKTTNTILYGIISTVAALYDNNIGQAACTIDDVLPRWMKAVYAE